MQMTSLEFFSEKNVEFWGYVAWNQLSVEGRKAFNFNFQLLTLEIFLKTQAQQEYTFKHPTSFQDFQGIQSFMETSHKSK